jgi:MGT family glycosyltransferase
MPARPRPAVLTTDCGQGPEPDRVAGPRRPAHILICNIPEHGHVNPTLAIVADLVRRGHRVSYPTTDQFAGRVAEAGATPLVHRSTLPGGGSDLEWPSDLAAGLDLFLTEAVDVAPRLLAAFADDRPDLVVHDIAAHAGRVLATRWSVPSVGLSPTHAIAPSTAREFDRLYASNADWIAYRARLAGFLREHGITLVDDAFPGPPESCVVTIPREFQLRPKTIPENYVFVGPCLRAGDAQATWVPPAADRKVLYISLGTCYANRPDFYRECVDAFAGLDPWHLVLSVGRLDPAELGPLPGNAEVHDSVPQLDVLRRASAFVTHAGMGSVLEALTYGVPMVAVPQAVDQPMNARQIGRLGLGTWLSPARATAEALRDAVLDVSSAEDVAGRLDRMRRAIAVSGGPHAAADVIERALTA